jgi:hypothetical protein
VRHYVRQGCPTGILALRKNPADGIAAGEYAEKVLPLIRHEHGTNSVLPHAFARALHARVWRQSERMLIPDDIGHSSHGDLLEQWRKQIEN